MRRFENRVAMVTGAARGIGEGIARRLAQEGAQVVGIDLLESQLQEVTRAWPGTGHAAKVCDITDAQAVEKMFEQVQEKYHRLDIMVNCAGIVGPSSTPILDYDYADFQHVIDVNLNAAFLLTKLALRAMLTTSYGRILHIASIGGKEGNPNMAGYAASKSGLMGLVKGVGKEYATSGVTVNGMAPAVIATPMNQDTDPAMLEYMRAKIPMNRLGTVDEVASLACWIVSEEASFNTGFIFDLSGGRATY